MGKGEAVDKASIIERLAGDYPALAVRLAGSAQRMDGALGAFRDRYNIPVEKVMDAVLSQSMKELQDLLDRADVSKGSEGE